MESHRQKTLQVLTHILESLYYHILHCSNPTCQAISWSHHVGPSFLFVFVMATIIFMFYNIYYLLYVCILLIFIFHNIVLTVLSDNTKIVVTKIVFTNCYVIMTNYYIIMTWWSVHLNYFSCMRICNTLRRHLSIPVYNISMLMSVN